MAAVSGIVLRQRTAVPGLPGRSMPVGDDRNATVRRTGAITLESVGRQQCSRHSSQRA
jgi:hypothetical protein